MLFWVANIAQLIRLYPPWCFFQFIFELWFEKDQYKQKDAGI